MKKNIVNRRKITIEVGEKLGNLMFLDPSESASRKTYSVMFIATDWLKKMSSGN